MRLGGRPWVCTLASAMLLWPSALPAQDGSAAAQLAEEVRAARGDAEAIAETLRADLAALVPEIPGWTCEPYPRTEGSVDSGRDLLAWAYLDCRHDGRRMQLILYLGPRVAEFACREYENVRRLLDGGRRETADRGVYQGGDWRFVRVHSFLHGCAGDLLSFSLSDGVGTEPGDARWLSDSRAFAEAMSDAEAAPIVEAFAASGYAAALEAVAAIQLARSRLLAETVPALPGATREVVFPSDDTRAGHLSSTDVLNLPRAKVGLTVGDCHIAVELTTVPGKLHVMRNGGSFLRFYDSTNPVALRTDRWTGIQAYDGSIEALVDDRVGMSIAPYEEGRPTLLLFQPEDCPGVPTIARDILEAVGAHDFSAF